MSIAFRSGGFLISPAVSVVGRRNLKSSLPIKWVRPEKIPCIKPKKSGDLKPVIEIDSTHYPLEFRNSEELKTILEISFDEIIFILIFPHIENSADETVKRLFSLQYFPKNKTVEVIRATYLDKVKRHQFDTRSPEARVAKMTADIRCMQQHMDKFPKNVKTKVCLKEVIDKRKKLLKFLRTWDYKCFEWILERLDLIYKPFPPQDVYKRIERKRSLRMLTDKYCEDIINRRLNEYKETLEAQQETFLENKIKTLKWIMKEEMDCGLDSSINEDDIKAVEDKLENLRKTKVGSLNG